MKPTYFVAMALSAMLGGALVSVVEQVASGQAAGQAAGGGQQGRPATPNADPYANNADAGTLKFPLAAAAGKDSGAATTPLAGAVNQGPFNPSTWKYGPAFNPPPNSKIWNPVKLKMMQGGKVTGGTLFASTDPSTYCAMANAGYDFIWTEMQHDSKDWGTVARMWATCPHAKAVPGVRVAYTFGDLERRSNRLAHLLRARGLRVQGSDVRESQITLALRADRPDGSRQRLGMPFGAMAEAWRSTVKKTGIWTVGLEASGAERLMRPA